MKRFSTLLSLALLGVFAACGGGEAPADDAATAAPEAAAPAPAVGGLSCTLQGATLAEARARPSPHMTLGFNLGAAPALLCYGAPSARGREVMDSLVPYGEPWRMGADEPTTLHLSSRAVLGGVVLQPGSYSIYAIPTPTEWTIFVNSNVARWGIPIDAAVRSTEIGSFTVVPQPLPEMAELLTYEWEEAAGGEPGGEILLEWTNVLIRIPIEG